MGVIKPTKEGRTYSIWTMLMNYMLFSMDKQLDKDFDPGFRISIINSCWIAIEPFTKECLYWHIMSDYNDMPVPDEFKFKKGCAATLKSIGKNKEELELKQFHEELILKELFANKAKNSTWYPAIKLCTEIDKPIEKKISQWEFLQNLYRLRNGLTHGQTIKILKSNFATINDEISKDYIKSIRYLNGKKIVNIDLLIENQNIADLLNTKVTNFLINETAKSFDDISNVFQGNYIASQWKSIRK